MGTESRQLQWVVCRAETRSVDADVVACPVGVIVSGRSCLDCRFLVTSSLERSQAGWCAVPEDQAPGVAVARRRELAPVLMAPASVPLPRIDQPSVQLPMIAGAARPRKSAAHLAELVAVGLA